MKDSLRQQLLTLRPAMKPLAGLFLVLAVWLTWMGIAQFIYESRRSDLGAILQGNKDAELEALQPETPKDTDLVRAIVELDAPALTEQSGMFAGKALTDAGMEDLDENALVHAKAYKITLGGKTTYAYISVATSKSSDKESRKGNYLTMGLSQ